MEERGVLMSGKLPVKSTSTPYDEKTNIEAFGRELEDVDNSDELISLSKDLVSAPKFNLWPRDLDGQKVQKMIIRMKNTKYKTGENGVRFQYVLWVAYSLGVFYRHRLIYDRVPFVIELPRKSFCNMFYRCASIEYGSLMQSLKNQYGEIPLLEVHFKKESPIKYTLKYLAVVKYDGIVDDQYQWTRERILFAEKGYKPTNMKIIKPSDE